MITLWMPTLFDAVGTDKSSSNQSDSHVYLYQATPTDKADPWQGYANLAAVAKDHPNAELCLYVPSTSVLQLPEWISSKRRQQLGETGVRYLFEEMTLTPVEQLQVKTWGVGDMQQLFALPQAQLEQWQYGTELVGLKLVAVLPDYLLLPIPKTGQRSAYLYYDKQTLLMRRSASGGGAIGYLPLMAQQWLADASGQVNDRQGNDTQIGETQISETQIDDRTGRAMASMSANVKQSVEQPVEPAPEAPKAEAKVADDTMMPHSSGTLDSVYVISSASITPLSDYDAILGTVGQTPHSSCKGSSHGWQEGINQLLSHGITVQSSQAVLTPVAQPSRHPLNFYHIKRQSMVSPYLKTAAMVMLVALVLQLAVDALQTKQYSTASKETQTAIGEQYQAWYPNERLNDRTQLQTQLSPKLISTGGQNNATSVQMQQISTLIRQSDVVVSVLTMQPERIEMTVLASSRQSLDTLVANLQQVGMNASLGTVSNVAGSLANNTATTNRQANTTASAANSQVQGQLVVALGS